MLEAYRLNCKPIDWRPESTLRQEAENLTQAQLSFLDALGITTSKYLEERLRVFLEKCIIDSNQKPPRSHILVLQALWGYGKTHAGKHILKRVAKELGIKHFYKSFEDLVEDAYQRLKRGEKDAFRETLSSFLQEIAGEEENSSNIAVVFLDEIEAFLEGYRLAREASRETNIRARVALGLVEELMELLKQVLRAEASTHSLQQLAGKIHLVLAMTPEALDAFNRIAREKGVGGRLARRLEVIAIPPLSRADAVKVVRSIVTKFFKLPDNVIDYRITNLLYTVSGGAIGILLSLVNQVVEEAYTLCREIYDRDCICSIQNARGFFYLLPKISVSYSPGSEKASRLIDENVARIVLDRRELDEASMEAILYQMPILRRDKKQFYRLYNSSLLNELRLGLVDVGVAGLDFLGVLRLKEEVKRVLRSLERSPETVELVLEGLIRIVDENNYLLVYPRELETAVAEINLLAQLPGQPVILEEEEVDSLIEAIEDSLAAMGVEVEDGVAVSTSSLINVYPALAERGVVFFVKDREVGLNALKKVQKARRESLDEFYQLVVEGLMHLLREGRRIVDLKGKPYLRLEKIYDTTYLIPIEISTLLGTSRKDKLEPTLTIRVAIQPIVASQVRKRELEVVLDLTIHQALLLAVLGFLAGSGEEKTLDRARLKSFADTVIQKLEKAIHDNNIPRILEEEGIAVPYLFPIREKKQSASILDYYRAFLVAGSHTSYRDLAEKLYALYRIRPYKRGSQSKWCKINVPQLLAVDLEPEDFRAYYTTQRKEKYIEWLVGEIRRFAEIGEEIGLIEESSDLTYYSLGLPPVSRRLLKILRKQPASINNLLEYFVFPESEKLRREAIKLLREVYIGVLEVRGDIVVKKGEILEYADINPKTSLRKVREDFAKKIEILNRSLRRVLGEECSIDDTSLVLSILIFKERGAKLITPSQILEALDAISNSRVPVAIAEDLRGLIEGYTTLFSKIIRRLRAYKEELNDLIESARKTYASGINLLRTLHPRLKYARLPEDVASNSFCKLFEASLREAEKIWRRILETPPSKIKDYDELKQAFFYDKCDTQHSFNLPLYFLEKNLEREKKELAEKIEALRGALTSLERRYILEADECDTELKSAASRILARYKSIKTLESLTEAVKEASSQLDRIAANCKQCIEEKKRIIDGLKSSYERLEAVFEKREELAGKMVALQLYLEGAEKLALGSERDKIAVLKSKPYYEAALRELEEQARRIQEDIVAEEERVERIICRDVRELKDLQKNVGEIALLVGELENRIREVENSINSVIDSVRQFFEDFKKRLEDELKRLKRIADSIKNIDIYMRVREELGKAERVLEEINVALGFEDEERIKRIDTLAVTFHSYLSRARELLKSFIERDLGGKSYSVLEAMHSTGLSREERLYRLVEEIAKTTGLREEEVLKALLELDKKDYYRIVLKRAGLA